MAQTVKRRNLILWGAGTPRTLRAYWALHELGLAYETRPIASRSGETRMPEYKQLNPKEKIPALQDGDITVTESAAIVTYLCETYGQPLGLIPPVATPERAAYYEWSFFTMMELDALSLYTLRRHGGLADQYGEAPNAVRAARESFAKQIQVADRKLALQGPFILGSTFTGADILLTSCLIWADRYDLPLTETLMNYRRLTTAREAHRAAVEENRWP
jgi:glutathione S-transferase